jgi:hypothetical protein
MTQNSGWISGYDNVGRDIPGDDAASADDRILADLGVGENDRARAN